MRDLYAVLGVKRDASLADVKLAYRTLAKKFHPDTNGGDKKAEERFKEVAAAYEVLGDPDRRAKYDKTGNASTSPVVIATKTGRYRLLSLEVVGDAADVYKAEDERTGSVVAVKVCRHRSDNDLLENEAKVLRAVYPDKTSKHKYALYLPTLLDSVKVEDNKIQHQTNVFEWLQSYYSLDRVRSAIPALRLEHGVWMMNRGLEILGYVHTRKKYVHGAVLPSHVMVYAGTAEKDPLNHGARLVGWSYSVPVGSTVKALSSDTDEKFYPLEVFRKKPVSAATDIYMLAKSIIHVLGGEVSCNARDEYPSHVPGYLVNFLRSCTLKSQAARPQDAWELHKELKAHMRLHYGPKKYIPFHMPSPT